MNKKSLPSFSALAQSIIVGGLYEHCKGLRYKIIGVALHSETLEELVVYQALYGEGGIWVRPPVLLIPIKHLFWLNLETNLEKPRKSIFLG